MPILVLFKHEWVSVTNILFGFHQIYNCSKDLSLEAESCHQTSLSIWPFRRKVTLQNFDWRREGWIGKTLCHIICHSFVSSFIFLSLDSLSCFLSVSLSLFKRDSFNLFFSNKLLSLSFCLSSLSLTYTHTIFISLFFFFISLSLSLWL